ncbi:unnamed protein product [Gadus morhua 'NCC']
MLDHQANCPSGPPTSENSRTPNLRSTPNLRRLQDLWSAALSADMYSHGSESLLKQARDIQDAEMAKFCSRMVKQTQARDQGPQGLQGRDQGLEAVDSLQRLHLILAASGRAQSLPSELHQRLLALLLSSSGEQLQVLCAAVLRETAPPSDHKLNYSQCSGGRLNSHALGLLVTQVSKEDLPSLCGLLLQSLEAPEGPAHSRAPEGPPHSLTHTLPALAAIISHSPDCLTEDHVTLLNKKLIDWLRYASTQQGGGASSVGFFNGPRIRQPGPVTELDGGPSGDFFTVLCVAQGFTEDQWMNAHAFSLLRPWLLASSAAPGDSSAEADDRSDVDGSVVSMVSATSSSSRLLAPRERLREKSFLYAQRLIEQSDRKALKRADSELQKACLVEAVLILDQVCLEDVSQVFRAFPAVKALYGRLSPELGAARVLLAVAQFYLNHGETAAVDCEPVWRLVFGRLPAELFNDPHLAHSLLRFTRLHLHHLQPRVVQYTQAFPNLLKFLAWDSPAVLEDFVDLLPSLVTPGTAVELLHSLLDLPCLSATLSSFQSEEAPPLDPKTCPRQSRASVFITQILQFVSRMDNKYKRMNSSERVRIVPPSSGSLPRQGFEPLREEDPDREVSGLNLIPYSLVTLQRSGARRPVLFSPAALAGPLLQRLLPRGAAAP